MLIMKTFFSPHSEFDDSSMNWIFLLDCFEAFFAERLQLGEDSNNLLSVKTIHTRSEKHQHKVSGVRTPEWLYYSLLEICALDHLTSKICRNNKENEKKSHVVAILFCSPESESRTLVSLECPNKVLPDLLSLIYFQKISCLLMLWKFEIINV